MAVQCQSSMKLCDSCTMPVKYEAVRWLYNVSQCLLHIFSKRALSHKKNCSQIYSFLHALVASFMHLRCRYASKCIFLPFLFFSTHLIENLSYISKMQSVFHRKTPMLVKIAIFFGYLKQFRPFKKKQK